MSELVAEARRWRPPTWLIAGGAIAAFVVVAGRGGGNQLPNTPPPITSTPASPDSTPTTPGATCGSLQLDEAFRALRAVLTSDQYGYDPGSPEEGSSIGKLGKGYLAFLGRPKGNGSPEGNGLQYYVLTTAGPGHNVKVTHAHGSPETVCARPFSVYPENSDKDTPAIGGYNQSPTAGQALHALAHAVALGSVTMEPPLAPVMALRGGQIAPAAIAA